MFRIIDIDALEPDQLAELVIGHVRQLLRGVEFRIAFHDPLLPGHLIEIFIVEDANNPAMIDPSPPVFRNRDQLGHIVHLHGAVADQSDHRPVGMREFAGDRIGHRRAHRGEPAGEGCHHATPYF